MGDTAAAVSSAIKGENAATAEAALNPAMPANRGVTPRVVFFSLLLALFFGYIDPVIDAKLANTFLGAQHLPPGAVGFPGDWGD